MMGYGLTDGHCALYILIISDAYLSGQPSKRRKLNAESKPRGDVTMLLQQSLQEAMDQTGLQPAAGREFLIFN